MSGELMFDPTKKKKKKRVDIESEAENVNADENSQEKVEDDLGDELNFGKKTQRKTGDEASADAPVDLDAPLGFTKKRKKKGALLEQSVDIQSPISSETANEYTYEELLIRAFKIMEERNPEMLSGERKKMIVKPPTLMRVGTKRTAFTNFYEICRQMRRKQEHLLAYLLAELGTSGSVDGNNQLIIKGRFQTKQIENVLRSYIKEYCVCHTCRSTETELTRDTRLFFLQCSTCGSRCTVQSIKSGFQAQIGKRSKMRAKAV